ncbi:MAG: carboxypeptidase-like regulatory domain-containing protein [Acidobacteria bacterium]|nr:carboxypeptidase-like regulatory domain-containing protein [Acidobacteriota bacterium]
MRVPNFLLGIVFLSGSLLSGFEGRLLAAGAGGLAGIVKDSRGAPLGGVAVTLLRGQFNPKIVQTVITDGMGRFEIRGLLPGLYSLKANLASYLPVIRSEIGIVAGKIADLNLILENLYLQSVLGATGAENKDAVREDMESVLRSASSTRPILRVFDSDGREDLEKSAAGGSRSGIRGVVGFSTTAYSTAPDLASAGTTFTDFAFIKDVGSTTTWVVAGVVSDSGFAELDSLLRFREADRHTTSVRLSLGILPYLRLPLSPVPDQNVRRLNMYNLDLQDELKLSEMLSVIYGAELQMTDPNSRASKFRPRWGLRVRPSAGAGYSFLRTQSLPQMQRTLELGEGDALELSSPFQHEFGNRLNFGMNRVTHTEAAAEHTLAASRFTVGVYSDELSSNYLTQNNTAGDSPLPQSRGVRIFFNRSLAGVEGVLGYTYGSGLQSNQSLSELTPHSFHVVAARVKSKLPITKTEVAATYRWISGDSITIIDPYQTAFDSSSPGVSLAFVQAIPYFGKFIPGKLEAQVDVRNLFARGNAELYQSASLRRVEFLQPARSVRGGIKLKF